MQKLDSVDSDQIDRTHEKWLTIRSAALSNTFTAHIR